MDNLEFNQKEVGYLHTSYVTLVPAGTSFLEGQHCSLQGSLLRNVADDSSSPEIYIVPSNTVKGSQQRESWQLSSSFISACPTSKVCGVFSSRDGFPICHVGLKRCTSLKTIMTTKWISTKATHFKAFCSLDLYTDVSSASAEDKSSGNVFWLSIFLLRDIPLSIWQRNPGISPPFYLQLFLQIQQIQVLQLISPPL